MNKTKLHSLAMWIGKAFLAGVIALTLLNIACLFYYNAPVLDYNTHGATSHKFVPYSSYSLAIEGYGHGRTNNDGYINLFDYDESKGVDVLVMGSSHMQGAEVAIEECTSSVLDSLLPDDIVYNIGIDGHYFNICCAALPAAIERYRPSKYVIIETSDFMITESEIEDVLAEKPIPMLSRPGRLAAALRHIPYLRLLNHQLTKYKAEVVQTDVQDVPCDDPALFDRLLSKLEQTASANDVKLIIAYHPVLVLQEDKVTFALDEAEVERFAQRCADHGIYFLDLGERILSEYDTSRILSNGFINTGVGRGHLNAEGHRMLAEELNRLIRQLGD